MNAKDTILQSLEPHFQEAEQKGLWFHASLQDLWFSPKELREKHKQDSFLWGPASWTLRDPQEYLSELIQRAVGANVAIDHFKQRMEESK